MEQQPQNEEMNDSSYHHQPCHSELQRQQSSDSAEDKHVSFANVQIRVFQQVLGDHPCCTAGPPVSLGWDYTESPAMSVEGYEATHPRRRLRSELKLSFDDRREILSEESDADMRRVQRRLSRERCCKDRAMKSFFRAPPFAI